MKSILIRDTTREEREKIISSSLDCGGGCENCSSCWLGGGDPWEIYRDYIDGKREELSKQIFEQAFPDYDEYDGTAFIFRKGCGRKTIFVPGLTDFLATQPHD